MWIVREEGLKEPDFLLDLVHPMLMVFWIMGVCFLLRFPISISMVSLVSA